MTKYKNVQVTRRDHPNLSATGYIPIPAGWVYAVRFGNEVKIGRTRSPQLRLADLQSKQRVAYDEVHLIPCDDSRIAERKLHKQFQACHLHGEWFNLSETQMRAISTIQEYKNGQFN
jgi:hypothetical protein